VSFIQVAPWLKGTLSNYTNMTAETKKIPFKRYFSTAPPLDTESLAYQQHEQPDAAQGWKNLTVSSTLYCCEWLCLLFSYGWRTDDGWLLFKKAPFGAFKYLVRFLIFLFCFPLLTVIFHNFFLISISKWWKKSSDKELYEFKSGGLVVNRVSNSSIFEASDA